MEVAVAKRSALLEMNVKTSSGAPQPFYGAFISGDGLALVNLSGLAMDEVPKVVTADGTRLEFGTIEGLFPEPELALVRFDHQPKVWLEISAVEPRIGEAVAIILPWDMLRKEESAAPPLIGPIMACRTDLTSPNILETGFRRILSFGGVYSPVQMAKSAPGVFAIDGRGRLVGVIGGTEPARGKSGASGQNLILLTSTAALGETGRGLASGGKPIPRQEAARLIDQSFLDEAYRNFHLAEQRNDRVEAEKHLRTLLERHPGNLHLMNKASAMELSDEEGRPFFGPEDFEPATGASSARQIAMLGPRAWLLIRSREEKGAIRTLKRIIEISPPDSLYGRLELASIYEHAGRLEEAIHLLEQAYVCGQDHIPLVEWLSSLMMRQGNEMRAEELSERVWELEEIYRRR